MTLRQSVSDLHRTIVQADEKQPGCRFIYAPVGGLTTDVQHPGLPHGKQRMCDADIDKLGAQGYIEFIRGKRYFVVTARGTDA
jgi:hypothetical protein